jgi:hypothetical protein
MGHRAKHLLADIEALCDELPEHNRGSEENWDHAHFLRREMTSCLGCLESVVMYLTPQADNDDCTLHQLEQFAGAGIPEGLARSGSSDAAPATSAPIETADCLKQFRQALASLPVQLSGLERHRERAAGDRHLVAPQRPRPLD